MACPTLCMLFVHESLVTHKVIRLYSVRVVEFRLRLHYVREQGTGKGSFQYV